MFFVKIYSPYGYTYTVFKEFANFFKFMRQLYRLILNDISDEALNKLRNRICTSERLLWLHHDISEPLPESIPQADVWIDLAVLHFLLERAALFAV